MRWTVHWSHRAVVELSDMPLRDARLSKRLVLTVSSFSRGERVDRKKLEGKADQWRLRYRDWRVVLTIDGANAYVETIDNRRDVY